MKTILTSFISATIFLSACNNNSPSAADTDSSSIIHPDTGVSQADTIPKPLDRDSSGRATLPEDSIKARN